MKRIAVLVSVLGLFYALSGVAVAHPPTNPYDNTIFAPVRVGGVPINLARVSNGFTSPLKGQTAPGHPRHLFVNDQAGKLTSVELSSGRKTVVLDVSARLVPLGIGGPNTFDERGFLGLAFHPRYAYNGLLYTWTSEPVAGAPTFPTTLPAGTAPNHQNVLAEWKVRNPRNPESGVDPASRREVMKVDWPQFNHNGGDIAFGPDGLLYVPLGDGGGADDEQVGHSAVGNAQDRSNPLGDILRIDVNKRTSANGQYGVPERNPFIGQPGVLPEIYAWGFRNPWRMSFNGDALIVGDIGQNDIEELDLVLRGGNYGWPYKEGTLFFNPNGSQAGTASREPFRPVPPRLVNPIAQYDTHHEGHSVIAGFVYRGSALPQLRGRYVFGEWSRLFNTPSGPNNYGRILYLENRPQGGLLPVVEASGFPSAAERIGLTRPDQPPAYFPQTLSVLGMGQDARGELYLMGNISGLPFGNDGVLVRITAPRR